MGTGMLHIMRSQEDTVCLNYFSQISNSLACQVVGTVAKAMSPATCTLPRLAYDDGDE